jgi:methyl-accepting chemotaxis protein PixJ
MLPLITRLKTTTLSLRQKTTLIAILLTTVPTILIGTVAYNVANRTLERNIQQDQALASQELIGKLNQFIFERHRDIQVLASLPIARDTKIRDSYSPAEKQKILDQYREQYDLYDSIMIADLQGNAIAQTSGKPLANISDRDYFQTALKTGAPAVGEPRISPVTGEASLFFAAPIKDSETGRIIGVVRTRLPLNLVLDLVSAYSVSGKDFRVFDQSDRVIFSTNMKDFGQAINTFYKGLPPSDATGRVKVLRTKDETNQTQKLLGLATTVNLNGMPNLNWHVAYGYLESDAFRSQNQLALILALGSLIAAATGSILAIYLVNRVTKPIQNAAQAVQAIGRGNLQTRLEVAGTDELSVLSSNINRMAQKLEGFVSLQNRTTELAQTLSQIVTDARKSLKRDEIVQTVVKQLRPALKADRVAAYFFDKSYSSGKILAESLDPQYRSLIGAELEDGCTEEMLQRYQPGSVRSINDILTEAISDCHRKMLSDCQIRASIVAPLYQNQKLIGLICIHQCSNSRDWTPEEVDLVKQVGLQMGFALDQGYLLAYTEQARREARFEADQRANQQQKEKENLQRRALELLMEVDPVSKGDLTIRATVTPDEVGTIADSYNAIISALRELVMQVQQAATTVSTTTTANEKSVNALSSDAKQQMGNVRLALRQVQATMKSIQIVAQRAAAAEESVQQATRTIDAGDAAMNRTVEGILTIRETVSETAKKVKRLGEASQKISKVVNLISSFAAQTNMLALNAAIEAARAGEEGRGFAVVAEEVRSLAQQSTTATAEIEQLVLEIQTQTHEVVSAMESGTDQVVIGTQLVEETRERLGEITLVSNQISLLIGEISQAANLQTQAYTTVSQTMEQVATTADDSSKQSEVVADSFAELSKVAQALQVSVSQFKVTH